jgi:homoserine kinase type II
MGTFRTLSTDDVAIILAGFGLDRASLRGHSAIAAGTINTNLDVDTARGRFFLRINEGKARQDVEREATIITHVAARGVPTPAPLLARDGAPFFDWNGSYVSLFPWVDGRTLARAEIGPPHARAAGVALAHLHLAGANFPDYRAGRYEAEEIRRRLVRVQALAGADPVLADATAVLGPELDRLEGERTAGLPVGLIHGDLFIDNILYTDRAEVAALLDFEQASWGRLAYDLAVSVLAFGFGRDDFRPEVTRALLDGYAAVRPLTPAERAGLGAELRFAACRFAVTRITDVYLRREAGAPAGKDFRRYLLRLRRVREHLASDHLLDPPSPTPPG